MPKKSFGFDLFFCLVTKKKKISEMAVGSSGNARAATYALMNIVSASGIVFANKVRYIYQRRRREKQRRLKTGFVRCPSVVVVVVVATQSSGCRFFFLVAALVSIFTPPPVASALFRVFS